MKEIVEKVEEADDLSGKTSGKGISSGRIRVTDGTSRKWLLVLLVFWVSTLILLAPPLLSIWVFGAKAPLIILSGTEFVSLTTLCLSAYFGANVIQRHIELRQGVDSNYRDSAESEKMPDPEDKIPGEPLDTLDTESDEGKVA